jgi:hypothetical protein
MGSVIAARMICHQLQMFKNHRFSLGILFYREGLPAWFEDVRVQILQLTVQILQPLPAPNRLYIIRGTTTR